MLATVHVIVFWGGCDDHDVLVGDVFVFNYFDEGLFDVSGYAWVEDSVHCGDAGHDFPYGWGIYSFKFCYFY